MRAICRHRRRSHLRAVGLGVLLHLLLLVLFVCISVCCLLSLLLLLLVVLFVTTIINMAALPVGARLRQRWPKGARRGDEHAGSRGYEILWYGIVWYGIV